MKEIQRNPSFTPSPGLRQYLNDSNHGVTATLNALYARYNALVINSSMPLTAAEQRELTKLVEKYHLGELLEVQRLPLTAREAGCERLYERLKKATFAQVLATLERYGHFNN